MSDYEYIDGENPMFVKEHSKLEKGTIMRFKVLDFRWMEADLQFQLLAKLAGDFLGHCKLLRKVSRIHPCNELSSRIRLLLVEFGELDSTVIDDPKEPRPSSTMASTDERRRQPSLKAQANGQSRKMKT